jgi:hypothetical protein
MCARNPETPGYCDALYENQARLITSGKYTDLISQMQRQYATYFASYRDYLSEMEDHHADPHIKRLLRIAAYQDLRATGALYKLSLGKRAECKLKIPEIAKAGKVGRTIADMKVPASLQGAWLAERLKCAQEGSPIRFPGFEARFVKTPTFEKLCEAFNFLINPPTTFCAVVFSDDMCFSIIVDGVVRRFNVDISSCDKSHGRELFEAYENLYPEHLHAEAVGLTDHCRLPMRVRSTCDPNVYTDWLPSIRPFMYSGTLITTSINTFASFLIAYTCWQDGAQCVADIERSAASIGYKVEAIPCHKVEDLQFLKHSPVFHESLGWIPLINLGVFLRSSGTVYGDLPGRGPLRERALAHQMALLECTYPRVSFPALERMRSLLLPADPDVVRRLRAEKFYDTSDAPLLRVTDEAVYRRYEGVTSVELDDFFTCPIFHTIANSSITRVLMKDYGLACNSYSNSPFPIGPVEVPFQTAVNG